MVKTYPTIKLFYLKVYATNPPEHGDLGQVIGKFATMDQAVAECNKRQEEDALHFYAVA